MGIRLNWRKRYITLAPVATLVGLAFRLRDPEGLLERGPMRQRRHRRRSGHHLRADPGQLARHRRSGSATIRWAVPFQNGPTEGHDVFVPLDSIIGGAAYAGHGWRMLMESLAAGRSVSLPALSVAGAEFAARATSAYALVRKQFDLPIGRFEGDRGAAGPHRRHDLPHERGPHAHRAAPSTPARSRPWSRRSSRRT